MSGAARALEPVEPEPEACPACQGTGRLGPGRLASVACPLCDGVPHTTAQLDRTQAPKQCCLPDELRFEDVAVLLREAIAKGRREVRKLRHRLNGDGSLRYVVSEEPPLRLSQEVWSQLERLCEASACDNRERPFLVAVDEAARRGIACFVGAVGDENRCEHAPGELLRARCEAPPHTALAFGHTHPVFWSDDRDLAHLRPYGPRAVFPRRFGGFPSNIYRGLGDWLAQQRNASAEAARVIEEVILCPRRYKSYGADACESLCKAHADYNPPGVGAASHFELILSPRLRQLGIFHITANADCVYVPWVVEQQHRQ